MTELYSYEDETRSDMKRAPASWRQLGVLVLDGSLSMTEPVDVDLPEGLSGPSKAQAVDGAVRDLLNELSHGRVANNFAFAFVDFHDIATVNKHRDTQGTEQAIIDLTAVDCGDSFDPTANGTGGTRLENGLREAAHLVRAFHQREGERLDLPTSAVVLVMSDGETADPAAAAAAAQLVKDCPETLVATALFSTKGRAATGGPLLQAIASDDPSSGRRMYETVFNGEQLRKFFHRSVSMASRRAAASVGDADVDLTV